MSFTEYVREYWVDIVNDTILHIDMTVAAVVLALIIGVGLGMLTYGHSTLAGLATTLTGAFLTIPSVALLGILIGPFGLGAAPVLVALVIYALLPITRNTIVGLQGVDAAVVEAAAGMGLGRTRMLWRVRLPLAWPVIFSGVRVSTQMIIGIAAIGAYVKGPGLGNQIFDGLGRLGSANSLNQVLVGTIGVVVLALLFDLVYVVVGGSPSPGGNVPETTDSDRRGRGGESIELADVTKQYAGQHEPGRRLACR